MHCVYLAIVVVFVAAIVIFVVQNRALVTISFLGILAVVVYVLGAITSGSLYAILRKAVRESQPTGAR